MRRDSKNRKKSKPKGSLVNSKQKNELPNYHLSNVARFSKSKIYNNATISPQRSNKRKKSKGLDTKNHNEAHRKSTLLSDKKDQFNIN